MEKQNDINLDASLREKEQDSEKSFVKKVKSRVSDFIPASISKWFSGDGSSVRAREDEDEECFQLEPPSKRPRIPTCRAFENNYKLNSSLITPHICYSPVSNSDIKSDNCVDVNSGSTTKNVLNSFPQPKAGPSGVKSRKLFIPSVSHIERKRYDESNINGDKSSESDESTSDYSSMARNGSRETTSPKDKVKQDEPKVDISQNIEDSMRDRSQMSYCRSLFSERGISPQMNSSLSSRRPSFNVSTFGTPNFVDKTLSTKKAINSPFYSGRTTYGGASAYCHTYKKNADVKNSLRNAFEVKPANESVKAENATLSKTARRILDTLEQYTTPVLEAKKIPNPSLRQNTKRESLLSKYTGANPYLIRESKTSSNKELQVPTVPDLLKMKLKEKLQDSTVAARQIATSSKAALKISEYTICEDQAKNEQPSKHVNKMKNKLSSVRKKPDMQELPVEVKLPEVVLPITTLPKFDFNVPPLSTQTKTDTNTISSLTTVKNTSTTHVMKQQTTTETDTGTKTETKVTKISVSSESKTISEPAPVTFKLQNTTLEFKFADPVVLADNLKSIIASNDFKFSEPVSKRETKDSQSSSILNNFKTNSGIVMLKRKSQNDLSLTAMASKLVPETVTDVLGKRGSDSTDLMSKFKPAPDTWECSVCLIKNLSDKQKCVACEAPKAKSEEFVKKLKVQNNKTDFGSQFKLSSNMWECSVCMVRNKNSDDKCVACTSLKPGSEKPDSNSFASSIPSATISTVDSFGDKFKPPTNTWECGVCMVRNKNDSNKCIACEALKPKGTDSIKSNRNIFGGASKKEETEWECSCCSVKNSQERKVCRCCETVKAGTARKINLPETKGGMSLFNFGVTGKGFTFGIPKEMREPEGSVKLLPAVTTTPASTKFTFGIKPVEQSNTSFTITSTSTETTKEDSVTINSTKNTSNANDSLTTNKVISTEFTLSSTSVCESNKAVLFNGDSSKKEGEKTMTNKKEEGLFKFGVPNTTTTVLTSTVTGPIFSFGSTNKSESKNFPTPATTSMGTTAFAFGSTPKSESTTFMFGSNVKTNEPPKTTLGETLATTTSNMPAFGTVTPSTVESHAKSEVNLSGFTLNNKTDSSHFAFGTMPKTDTNTQQTFGIPSKSDSVIPAFGSTTTTTTSMLCTAAKMDTHARLSKTASKSSTSIFETTAKSDTSSRKANSKQDSTASIFNSTSQASTVAPMFETSVKPDLSTSIFGSTPKSDASGSIFGEVVTSNTSVFGSAPKSDITTPVFGTKPDSSSLIFGDAPKTDANRSIFGTNEPSVFKFGGTQAQSEEASKPLPFGSCAFQPPTNNPFGAPSSFDANKPTFGMPTSTTQTVFGFGSNSQTTQVVFGQQTADVPKPGAFSFGQENKPQEITRQPIFNFGSSTNLAVPGGFNLPASSSNFSFKPNFTTGSSTQQPANVFGSSAFGSSAQQSQSVQNGGFSFGSGPTPAKTTFSFGTQSQAATQPAAIFNFGSSNTNATTGSTTGGFNFQPPQFSADSKPNFNFTGGATPVFPTSPIPSQPLPAQRKKIKAVRRTQR